MAKALSVPIGRDPPFFFKLETYWTKRHIKSFRCNGTVKKDFVVSSLKFLQKRSKGGNRTSFCYLLSSQLKLFQI